MRKAPPFLWSRRAGSFAAVDRFSVFRTIPSDRLALSAGLHVRFMGETGLSMDKSSGTAKKKGRAKRPPPSRLTRVQRSRAMMSASLDGRRNKTWYDTERLAMDRLESEVGIQ